jgi:hypothetical protein
LISEIKFIQAAPPTSITGESALKLCKVLIITITNPKSPRQSTQWLPSTTFPRADRIAKAPAIAPNPKHQQYPVSDCGLFRLRASVGRCLMAAQRGHSIEETADKLLEISPRAQERARLHDEGYGLITAQNAAAAAEQGRKRGRA